MSAVPEDVRALADKLRAVYTSWNNPPSPGLPEGAAVLLEAAAFLAARASVPPVTDAREEVEKLGGGDVIALFDDADWNLPDAPQLAFANGYNTALAERERHRAETEASR